VLKNSSILNGLDDLNANRLYANFESNMMVKVEKPCTISREQYNARPTVV